MWESLIFVVLLFAGWIVVDGLRAREAAIRSATDACRAEGLQFLDDTVRSVRTDVSRNAAGRLALRRTYAFEFSDDGTSRRDGAIVILGDAVEAIQLEPYRLT